MLFLIEIEVHRILWLPRKFVLEDTTKELIPFFDNNKVIWQFNIKHGKNKIIFVGQWTIADNEPFYLYYKGKNKNNSNNSSYQYWLYKDNKQ